MPETDREGAMAASQKIRAAIEAEPFANQERQPTGNLTISGGIAVMPTDGKSATDLIGRADQGLYEAKKAGRNRVMHAQGIAMGAMPMSEDTGGRPAGETGPVSKAG